jgi:predicted ATPase
MEQLYVKNLYSLDEVTIDVQSINVFIGSQAEGKSLLMKVLWFVKSLPIFMQRSFFNLKADSEIEFKKIYENLFIKFFNASSLKNCEIKFYKNNELIVSIKKIKSIQIFYHNKISQLFKKYLRLTKNSSYSSIGEYQNTLKNISNHFLEEISSSFPNFGHLGIYVPASRSLYSALQSNTFRLMSIQKSIDPIFIEFSEIYEFIKILHEREIVKFYHPQIIYNLLKGHYERKHQKEFIKNDKYSTEITFASSGQQEILPILITLDYIVQPEYKEFDLNCPIDLYIEEPEAHLFPETQLHLTKYIIQIYNTTQKTSKNSTITITTHTPYLLTIINNCIQLGQIPPHLQTPEDSQCSLQSSEVSAYFLHHGTATSIIDTESGMIQADPIDSVSESIAQQFDQTLERIYEQR